MHSSLEGSQAPGMKWQQRPPMLQVLLLQERHLHAGAVLVQPVCGVLGAEVLRQLVPELLQPDLHEHPGPGCGGAGPACLTGTPHQLVQTCCEPCEAPNAGSPSTQPASMTWQRLKFQDAQLLCSLQQGWTYRTSGQQELAPSAAHVHPRMHHLCKLRNPSPQFRALQRQGGRTCACP